MMLNQPQVGDQILAPDGTHYRRIVEVVGLMEDGRIQVKAIDLRDEYIVAIALTFHEPMPKPTTTRKRRPRAPLPRMTPALRLAVETGTKCRRGHDLTGKEPNGKPTLYLSPRGQRLCRACRSRTSDASGVEAASDE